MKKNDLSLTEKSSFVNQLRQFGILKIIKGFDFKIAVAFLIIYHLDGKLNLNFLSHDDNNSYIATIMGASSVLFALTITSLSLILSFSSSNFVKFLHKHNQFSSILFSFWLGNGAYLLSIAMSLLCLIVNSTSLPTFHATLFVVTVGVFVYALADTFYLLGIIIRFGHFMSAFEDKLQK